jgi:hypothetical protein
MRYSGRAIMLKHVRRDLTDEYEFQPPTKMQYAHWPLAKSANGHKTECAKLFIATATAFMHL